MPKWSCVYRWYYNTARFGLLEDRLEERVR